MPNFIETFITEYKTSDDLRAVKSTLRICSIGAYSDYQNGQVIGITINASVDIVQEFFKENK